MGAPAVSTPGRTDGICAVAMGQSGGVLTETWVVEVTGCGDGRGMTAQSSPAGASRCWVPFTRVGRWGGRSRWGERGQ